MSQDQAFQSNYHGILTHDGWIKVAKFKITAKISNIQNKKILVKGVKKGSWACKVHKNLLNEIPFMDINDTVGIRWNCGKPYIVAYRKSNYDKSEAIVTGDSAVSENMDWITFFNRMEME